jgi:hypothetical protein
METNPSRAIGVMGGAQIGVQLPLFNRNFTSLREARLHGRKKTATTENAPLVSRAVGARP